MVLFTVMSVVVAAALPLWSTAIRRQREEELIFRGLQYAEAIRVFQLRHGRFPVRLEELLQVRPRSIRQLWKDPMTKGGEWGLIYAQAPAARRQRRRGGPVGGVAPEQQTPQTIGGSAPRPLGGEEGARSPSRGSAARAVAPIIGVHSLSDDEAIKTFLGGGKYGDWRFTVEILPTAQVLPGSLIPVRANSRWVGRPFPPDLAPAQGSAPEPAEVAPARPARRRRSNRSGG